MSIFNDVKDLAAGSKKSKDWYRSQFMYGLEDSKGFNVGDVIFFSYTAQTEGLQYYDRYPMVLITDIDLPMKQFSGGNLHYLRPSTRSSIGRSWGGGSLSYPMRCHHKYFMSNAGNIKSVPSVDLREMKVPLPLEQFTMDVVGRWIDVPSSIIWSRQ